MAYGAEPVLPSDVRFSAPRVIAYTEEASNAALTQDMDALDEARTSHLLDLPRANRSVATTTVDGSAVDLSLKETWFFD